MKTKLPWRMHNLGGWREACATAGLTLAEEAVLVRLQDLQWLHGTIPAAPTAAMTAISLNTTAKDLKGVRVARLLEFFPMMPGDPTRRRDPELFDEWERARERAESLRIKGRRGAYSRWHSRPTPHESPRNGPDEAS